MAETAIDPKDDTQRGTAGRRVLLAEDSSVTSDLISLILSQRGHHTDLYADGQSALAALSTRPYDVALLDFHLPDISGLEVVSRYLRKTPDGPRPRFIAITGDVKGLLGDRKNCEVFDRVVPKPLDIDLVCDLVEADDDTATRAVPSATAAPASAIAPPAASPPAKAPASSALDALNALDIAYLRCKPGTDTAVPVSGLEPAEHDAVLVQGTGALATLWSLRGAHLLPVIDMTGLLGASADLDGSDLRLGGVAEVGDLIRKFHERRAELHGDLIGSADLGDRLLGRIHVAGGRLEPRHDGAERGLVAYNTVLAPDHVTRQLTKLRADGLVKTEFFDRLHACTACGSARLNLREECGACRGARLAEDAYLHHFRCAYQGLESDFRQGDDLICPKCRRALTHFGQDYDRPGAMVRCDDCGAATSEPAVGFVCADCGQRGDGEAMPTRDVSGASLTDHGRGYLRAGQSFLGLAGRSLRFADLPLGLVVALNAAARDFNATGTPFALCHIRYANAQEITRSEGPRQFTMARRQFLEALGQTLGQTLGPDARVERGHSYDYVLMRGIDPADCQPRLFGARDEAAQTLRLDLGIETDILGPEDIAP